MVVQWRWIQSHTYIHVHVHVCTKFEFCPDKCTTTPLYTIRAEFMLEAHTYRSVCSLSQSTYPMTMYMYIQVYPPITMCTPYYRVHVYPLLQSAPPSTKNTLYHKVYPLLQNIPPITKCPPLLLWGVIIDILHWGYIWQQDTHFLQ